MLYNAVIGIVIVAVAGTLYYAYKLRKSGASDKGEAKMLMDAVTLMFSRTVDVDLSTDRYYVKSNEDGVIRAFSDYDRGIVEIEKNAIAEGQNRDDYLNTFSRVALYDAYKKGIRKITRRYKTSDEGLVDRYVEMTAVFLDSEGKHKPNVIILVHEIEQDAATENLEKELLAKNAEINKLNEENRKMQKTLSLRRQTLHDNRDTLFNRLKENEGKFAEENKKLEQENDDLKNKLNEISKYTQELDLKYIERVELMAEENRKLKDQLDEQRDELAKAFEAEKKQLENQIWKEKNEINKLTSNNPEDALHLSAQTRQELEEQRTQFTKKLEESKVLASNYLDSAYEEMESFIEKERAHLAQKHDVQLMELAKKFNSEKTEYKKMLANLDEENTALENMLAEERLDYARKLSDAKKHFETKMNVQRMKNAELIATVAAGLQAVRESAKPAPAVIEVDPEVQIKTYDFPTVKREKPVMPAEEEPKKTLAPVIENVGDTTIIFSKVGITDLKHDMKGVIQEIKDICDEASVGISIKFGEIANPVVHVDTDEINKVVVGMVRDAAVYARKGSTMVLAVNQVSDFKYGYAEYEYKITYVGNRIVFNEKPANHLGGSYKESSNDDGSKTITVRFRWELI